MTSKPSVEVILSQHFQRSIKQLRKKYRHIVQDMDPLFSQLARGETPGDQIVGVRGTVFKVRIASSDAQRGKSGGFRVVYYLRTQLSVFLVEIYIKNAQTDISADELRRLIAEVEEELDAEE